MSNIWNKFLFEVEEIEEMAARYKEKGVELPSQLEEIETYVSDPPKYFITFTADLRPSVADLTNKKELQEIKGRTKRRFGKKRGEKRPAWWKSLATGSDPAAKAQRSPSIPKVGINPRSKYNTPNGIYSYPLTPSIYYELKTGTLPFAQNQPYFSIFKIPPGSSIFKVDQNGDVKGFDETDYENYLDALISSDFFHKLSQKRVQGQKKGDDAKDFWINYQIALEITQEGDFSGIKDGFGGEFVKKYLKPRIKSVASYHNVHTMHLKETDRIYLELDQLLDEEYEGMPDDVEIDRYQYLDSFEIFIEDLSALLFDWNLTSRKDEQADLKRAAIDLLSSRVFKNPENWKNIRSSDDWIKEVDKISKESDHWLEQKAYPLLTEYDLRVVNSMFQAYEDYVREDNNDLLPERLMPLLVNMMIAEINGINDELAGNRKKKGDIESFVEFESYGRRHPKNTDFVKKIENRVLVDTPFGRLWAVTRALADTERDPKSTDKWARILKYLGIDGIIDLGSGLVHKSEPTQAVVFDLKSIKVVKSFENKSSPTKLGSYGKGQRTKGKLLGRFLKVARNLTKLKRIPKEYHKELERLSGGVMGKANMGLKGLQMLIVRNQMHFPASDEHLLKRLEDENFMRGTPDDADRQLPFDTNEAIAALTDEEFSKIIKMGHLPLFNPNYVGMFSMIEELNATEANTLKKYNKAISNLGTNLANLAKDDNAKSILKQVTTLTQGMKPENINWYLLRTVFDDAADAGFPMSDLQANLSDLMKMQGVVKGFTHQRFAIEMQKAIAVETAKDHSASAADKLINMVYPELVKRTRGLISGEIDTVTLLDIRHQRYGNKYDEFTVQLKKAKKDKEEERVAWDAEGNKVPWEKAYDDLVTEIRMFFEKYERKGKCVYKQETGEKKGCSDTVSMAKKYVKALYANTDDIKEEIEEYFLREEEEEEEEFNDVSTEDILDPTIPAPWETND